MQNYCMNCMKELKGSPVCARCGYDNSRPAAHEPYHLAPGTLLSGKYLVGNVLGEGGFGITYIGMHTTLFKRVAIKEFYPAGAANRVNITHVHVTGGKQDFFQKGVQRFLDEAKNVAKFSEEDGIVDIIDYFQENNTAYIVMEYLEGENLKHYVNNHGAFDAETIISLMIPLMNSLAAIHAEGVIHRDISPDNIMYCKNKLKLMDFGSARYFTNKERQMSVILKQGFAPEEQYRTNGVQGPHTDVYAICATIYACITSRVPTGSLDRISNDTLIRPSELGVRIPAYVENALMHGLAVFAKDRTPDIPTLIKELTTENTQFPRQVSKTAVPENYTYNQTWQQNSYTPQTAAPNIGNSYSPQTTAPNSYTPSYTPNSYAPEPNNNGNSYIPPTPPSPKKSKLPLILGITIPSIVVVAAAIIAIIALNGDKGKGSETTGVLSNTSQSNNISRAQNSSGSKVFNFSFNDNSSGQSGTNSFSSFISDSGSSSRQSSKSSSAVGFDAAESKENAVAIARYFLKHILTADNQAKEGDYIQSKELYFCESTKSNYRRLVYVYYNSTQKYYRAVEHNPDNMYLEDGAVLSKSTYFSRNKSADTLEQAKKNVMYISSTTGRYKVTKVG